MLSKAESDKLILPINKFYYYHFFKALFDVFESLHCWSLVDSESFLYLLSSVGGSSESFYAVPDGRLIQPTRCDLNAKYILFNTEKRQGLSETENSACFYFGEKSWQTCASCDQCPKALFFKVEKEENSVLLSPLYIATLFSIVMTVLLFILVIFSR